MCDKDVITYPEFQSCTHNAIIYPMRQGVSDIHLFYNCFHTQSSLNISV